MYFVLFFLFFNSRSGKNLRRRQYKKRSFLFIVSTLNLYIMYLVTIHRNYVDSRQTSGVLKVFDNLGRVIFSCVTLELPWKNNERRVSCIPSGRYSVIPRDSVKFGFHFQILDVPKREYILFHFGNYVTDVEGCILVGQNLVDINSDGLLDVSASRKTMNTLLSIVGKGFNLVII